MPRAISGHATESMQRHNSTARDHEITAGLAGVLALAAPRVPPSAPADAALVI